MSKVVPLKIDTGLGKVKPKDRGLDMVEFANNDELRRNQLEKLVAGFRLFSYFGYDEGVAGHISPIFLFFIKKLFWLISPPYFSDPLIKSLWAIWILRATDKVKPSAISATGCAKTGEVAKTWILFLKQYS